MKFKSAYGKRLSLLAYSLLGLFCVSSVGQAWAQASDPEAENMLKRSKQKIESFKSISAAFTKTVYRTASSKKGLSYSGSLKMKGDKFQIRINDQLIYCNGTYLWSYLKSDQEVTVSNYDPETGFTPEKIFSITQEDMKARLEGQETVEGHTTHHLTLFSNSKYSDYFKIGVWLDSRELFPRKIKIFNRTGSIVVYEVKNVQLNTGLSDADFVFDASRYPGVEVVDNRD